jgi:hypothetical protein
MAGQAQLTEAQRVALTLQIRKDPRLNALAAQILALQPQFAPAAGETGAANYARTDAARQQATALTQQYKQLASTYMPDGFEATGVTSDGLPLLFNKEDHTANNVTYAMLIGAVGAGAIAALPAVAGAAPAATSGALPAGVTLEGTAAGVGGAAGASTAVGAGGVAGGVEAGATAGLGSTALAGAGTALPTVAGAGAGIGEFAGPIAANGSMGGGSGTVAGISYGDLLKYGVGTGGQIVGSLIQANAAGNASEAQQKYLEEALAYQKESDAYARTTDAARYADTRGDVAKADARYGDYQGRIAPWIANGTNSNDRMSALLGLPARAAGSGGSSGGGSYGAATSQGVTLSPEITARIAANYKSLWLTPTGAGSGPTDIGYYGDRVAETGGLTDANNRYWFGPTGRIATDAAKAGLTGAPSTGAPSAPTPAAPTPAAPSAASVQMRGPDGSVKTVSADQVDHYTQLGATVLGAAA